MLKKFKHHKLFFTFLFIFGTPIFFIGILKLYYVILPGKEIGSVGDWISFSGGYVGAILALGGIWWQINHSKLEKQAELEEEYNNLIIFILDILNYNLKELKKSKQNLTFAWTIHRIFIDDTSLLKYRELDKSIINKYNSLFFKNGHSCILDLYFLILEIKKIIRTSIKNCEIKSKCLKNITYEIELLKNKIDSKSDLETPILKEKYMILQNFISCSIITNNPSGIFLFFYEKNGTNESGIIFNSDLKSNKIFRNYTAIDRLKKRELSKESFFILYKEYYQELRSTLSIPSRLPGDDENEFYKRNSNLYEKIDYLYAFDIRREELLNEYEKLLNHSIENLSKFINKI